MSVAARLNDVLIPHRLYRFSNPSIAATNPPLVIENGSGVYVTNGQGWPIISPPLTRAHVKVMVDAFGTAVGVVARAL